MTFHLSSGLVSVLVLFAAIFWMLRDEQDKTRVLLFFGILANVVYASVEQASMRMMGGLLPWKYDHVLYRVDAALGCSAFSIAQSIPPAVMPALNVIYQLMVPVMIALYLVGAGKKMRRSVSVTYFAELVGGPLLYSLLPACGPLYAFPSAWPRAVQNVSLAAVKLDGVPNAFPSLHLATAIVVLAYAKPGVVRIVAALFFVGTAIATIATGEHYCIDLVAGLTFGCFAYSAGRARWTTAAAFLALTTLDSLAIRFAPGLLVAHPLLLRGMVIATIAGSAVYMVRSIMQLEAARPSPQPISQPLIANAK